MTRMNQCTSSGTSQLLPERVKADLPVKEGQSMCVCVCCVNNLLHMYLLMHVITHVTVPQFHAQHNHTLSLTGQPPFTLLPPHSQAPHAKCKKAQGGHSTSIQAAPYQLPCYPLHSCQQTAKGQAEKVIRGRLLRNPSKVRFSTRPGLVIGATAGWFSCKGMEQSST